MEFVEIAAIMGGLVSVISAFLALRVTEKRLGVEKDLNEELSMYLKKHYEIMQSLEYAKKKGNIKLEVINHLELYEKILNEIVTSMPDEKRSEVYPAINQASEKGKIAYISKLISRSLSEA